jgi:Flp pilus assembly protein TadD
MAVEARIRNIMAGADAHCAIAGAPQNSTCQRAGAISTFQGMSVLEPPDSHTVRAAQGWMDLGNPREAAAELARLSPRALGYPEALEVRWRLCASQKQWNEALAIAGELVAAAPNNAAGWVDQSYALHELRRTAEARALLMPAANRFPEVCIIPYNLACYACGLGDLDEARRWLERAAQIRDRSEIRAMALEDADLEPLWPLIRTW